MLNLYTYFFQKCIYRRDFDETKWMYLLIKEEKVFDKYNEIQEKVCNIIKKEFNGKLVYNKKYLQAEKQINTKEGFLNTSNID